MAVAEPEPDFRKLAAERARMSPFKVALKRMAREHDVGIDVALTALVWCLPDPPVGNDPHR